MNYGEAERMIDEALRMVEGKMQFEPDVKVAAVSAILSVPKITFEGLGGEIVQIDDLATIFDAATHMLRHKQILEV